MAVLVIQEFEATTELYDKVNEKLDDQQPGGILHAAIDLGNGKMRAVDVWESREDWENFVQSKLIPAIAEVDPNAPQAGEPEVHEIYDLQQQS
jgi:hypothetical protein